MSTYKETRNTWINIHILQKEENKRHLAFTRIIKTKHILQGILPPVSPYILNCRAQPLDLFLNVALPPPTPELLPVVTFKLPVVDKLPQQPAYFS
jgi:hypothetical protein